VGAESALETSQPTKLMSVTTITPNQNHSAACGRNQSSRSAVVLARSTVCTEAGWPRRPQTVDWRL
jgi:hypothetical protein